MEQNKLVYKEKILNIKENKEEMIEQYLSILIQYNYMANSFSIYRYLRFINISHSSISKIPTDFGTLPHLENLDLSDNILGENNDNKSWLWLRQTVIKNNLLFLDLSNNSLTELPVQVTRLNVLETLKISHNKLKYLPQSIRYLQRLSILDVSDNILGQNNDDDSWLWLRETAIKNNLLSLDLSNNSLTELPIQVMRLNVLKTLKISHNKLKYLPQSIRYLQRLSILDVSDNSLVYLPESICNISLDHIDITMNPFLDTATYELLNNALEYEDNVKKMPSLVELSFKKFIQARITYDTGKRHTLIEYYDKIVEYCAYCEKPCIDSYVRALTDEVPSYTIARSVQMSSNVPLQFERYACSKNCYDECWLRYYREHHVFEVQPRYL